MAGAELGTVASQCHYAGERARKKLRAAGRRAPDSSKHFDKPGALGLDRLHIMMPGAQGFRGPKGRVNSLERGIVHNDAERLTSTLGRGQIF